MPRGFEWGVYYDDWGTGWALRVDADYLQDTDRGWESAVGAQLSPLPRGWLPRRVVGIDGSGRRVDAVVARLDAPLWTLAAPDFVFTANDGTNQLAHVIMLLEERAVRS